MFRFSVFSGSKWADSQLIPFAFRSQDGTAWLRIREGDFYFNGSNWVPVLRDDHFRVAANVVGSTVTLTVFYNHSTLASPTIVIMGSSTAAGYNLNINQTIEYKVRQGLTAWGGGTVINIGYSGADSTKFLPDGDIPGVRITDALAYRPAIILFFAPSNDISAGNSISSWINNVKTIKELAEKGGARFFGQLCGPRDQYSQLEQQQLLNAALAFAAEPEFTYCSFNVYDSPLWIKGDPLNPAKTNPLYFQSDKIHPNDAGTTYIFENFVKPILQRELRPVTAYARYVVEHSVNGTSGWSPIFEQTDPQQVKFTIPKINGFLRVLAYMKNGQPRVSNLISVLNLPPVANAGADQLLSSGTTSANLDGTASLDQDGAIVSFLWEQISGPAVLISTPTSAQTIINGLINGAYYQFRLTVTDNSGATNTDAVVVAVAAATFIPYTLWLDLGGNGTNTLNGDGFARGALTLSPDGTGKYWNNLFGLSNGTGFRTGYSIFNLVDGQGVDRGVSFTINEKMYGSYVGGNSTYGVNMYAGSTGNTGGGATVAVGPADDPNRYPVTATQDSLFVYADNGDAGKFTIGGLDPLNTYEYYYWGARNDGTSSTRIIQIKLDGEPWASAVQYDARNNTVYGNGGLLKGGSGKSSQAFNARAPTDVGVNNLFGYIGVIEVRATRN